MNVISESALIAGVEDTRARGDRAFGVAEGMGHGLRHFRHVFGLKLIFFVLEITSVALVGTPAALAGLGVVPLWAGVTITALLALPALPWLLTVYFLRQYALRIAVLDGCGVFEALRGGWTHLHGRIAESLALLGVSLVGVAASSLVALAFAVPAALIGGLLYLLAGLVPAIVVGAALLIPGVFCALGFQGTYRSSVWTLAYLEAADAAAR
jgi:hypothetical protein